MAFFTIFISEIMSISETYRKRLPILTRTIFEDVMNISIPETDSIEIPKEFVKDELNQEVWSGTELRPEVYEKILKIIQVYKEHLKLEIEPKAIYFLGSMANYNWTQFSDIDIHLFYDLSKISDDIEFAKEFLEAKGVEWKNKHKITLRGYSVEMYAQDIKDNFYSGGIYDLIKNKWVSKPSKEKVVVDRNLLRKKIIEVVKEIRLLNKLTKSDSSEVYKKAKAIKDKIKTMRQSGLDESGEYSIENLAFKFLRNKGYLEKLSDIVLKAFDKQLSLDEKQTLNESMKDVADRTGINVNKLKQKVFTHKRNPQLTITVTMTLDGRIVDIDNLANMRFPFSEGQILNMSHETWACNNNFTVNGKDTCPEEKIFGIRKKDIPQGHELRMLYPGKFKNESVETKLSKDIVSAGKKANIDLDKYDPKELNKGFDVEKEHGNINPETNVTNDNDVKTLKIALAHLNEIPDYYTKLSKYVETEENMNESDIIWTKDTAQILESYNKNKKLLKESTNNVDKKHKLIIKKTVDNFDALKIKLTQEFIVDCCKELGIEEPCHVFMTGARGGPIITTASYNPNNDHIWIYTKNRNMLADPLRSLAHEIRHFKQKLDGVLHEKSGEDGSEHENEANSFSGLMIRKFGKQHREIYL